MGFLELPEIKEVISMEVMVNINLKGKYWAVLITLAVLAMGLPNDVAASESEQQKPGVSYEITGVKYLNDGKPMTEFRVYTHNFPKNAVVTVGMYNLNNQGFPMELVLDDEGRPCTGPAHALQPALFVATANIPGEPIMLEVREQGGGGAADAILVPVPLMAKDANGRVLEAIMMSPTGSEYLLRLRGFKPNEKVTYTSKQYGEVVTGSVTIDEDGVGRLVFGPEVLGKKKGIAKLEFSGEQTKLALGLQWGQTPRDLVAHRRAKC